MKYIEFDRESGSYVWDRYFEYLRLHRDRFPAGLYAYASNWANYSLDDRESLHDSWLQSIQVTRNRSGGIIGVELGLLGAFHDRLHLLTYSGVKSFAVDLQTSGTASSDLIVHEFRVEEDAFVHELAFVAQQTIRVSFSDFQCRQEAVPDRKS